MINRRHVIVHGRVQGVFFRDRCRAEAERRQVSGWVLNRPDGTVEAVFEGEAAALVDWVNHGPPSASVSRVEVTTEEPEGESRFRSDPA